MAPMGNGTKYIALATLSAIIAASVSASGAQPEPASDDSVRTAPNESLTITAPKLAPDAVINGIVKSYAAPSAALGKIARWHNRVCPMTTGLPEGENTFVTTRIKKIAAMIGAPVRAEDSCKGNIDVVFTVNPQVLLDGIRAEHPALLGYHDRSQETTLATVNHPVQAWYTTQTADSDGMRSVDDKRPHITMEMQTVGPGGAVSSVYVPAPGTRSNGSRLGDDLSSELYHVVIVVDLDKAGADDIGPVADYIAMLALSQVQSYDACHGPTSIINLMAKDCDASQRPNAITDIDLAYLRGLYKMDAGGTLQQQQRDIADQIKSGLPGR
jgi:hypothetical protein